MIYFAKNNRTEFFTIGYAYNITDIQKQLRIMPSGVWELVATVGGNEQRKREICAYLLEYEQAPGVFKLPEGILTQTIESFGLAKSLAQSGARKCVRCKRAVTGTLRRNRCPKCYLRWYRGRDTKSECECCGNNDIRVLQAHKMKDAPARVTICANCGAIAGQGPTKLGLAALKTVIQDTAQNFGEKKNGSST